MADDIFESIVLGVKKSRGELGQLWRTCSLLSSFARRQICFFSVQIQSNCDECSSYFLVRDVRVAYRYTWVMVWKMGKQLLSNKTIWGICVKFLENGSCFLLMVPHFLKM